MEIFIKWLELLFQVTSTPRAERCNGDSPRCAMEQLRETLKQRSAAQALGPMVDPYGFIGITIGINMVIMG